MRFVWGCPQEIATSTSAGFDFEFATQIFEGRTREREDTRRDYGERRMIAIGIADAIALTLVYTDRVETGAGLFDASSRLA